jgi:lipoprotein signal peptidase
MNLKLTKGKAIISIIIPIILWVLVFSIINTSWITNFPAFVIRFLVMHNTGNLFSTDNIVLFIIEIVVVYLILSIFQKKKKAPNPQAQSIPPQQPDSSQSLNSPKVQILPQQNL